MMPIVPVLLIPIFTYIIKILVVNVDTFSIYMEQRSDSGRIFIFNISINVH